MALQLVLSSTGSSASATVHDDNEPDVIADDDSDDDCLDTDECTWCNRPARYCGCDEAYERDERMGL